MTPYLDADDFLHLDQPLRAECHRRIIDPSLAALKKRGYEVNVSHHLCELRDFWNEHNGAEGLKRTTAFDCRYQPDGMVHGVFLEAADGQKIGTVWRKLARLCDPRDGRNLTLKQALEGLYLFYSDPMDAPRREECVCDFDAADDIKRCTISYGGALWIHPDHRGLEIFKPFTLLSRVLSLASSEPWHYYVLITDHEHRVMALDHFPIMGLYHGVTHREAPHWRKEKKLIGLATYQEAIKRTFEAAEGFKNDDN